MDNRKVLYADEGMFYTNGKIYGRIIYLADCMNPDDFYQITEAEYEEKFNGSEYN